jgi:hypothetical protein
MALEGRNSAIHVHDPDEKPDNFQVLAVRLTEFGGYDKIKVYLALVFFPLILKRKGTVQLKCFDFFLFL